jgi:ribose transport system substrate-binding protein/inositol transport system substrate-binding protein
MKTAAEAIGGKGNVAFLLGPMGSDAQIGRMRATTKSQRLPDIKVVLSKPPIGKLTKLCPG